ncbi:hypothetical protein LSAT2_029046 [Lamellibrachia satsuma]|nr:hypothetical protein LSAT2_029046 [Lamellibrachia satsuma]
MDYMKCLAAIVTNTSALDLAYYNVSLGVLSDNGSSTATNATQAASLYLVTMEYVRTFLRTNVVPVICVFGMVGNVLTLLTLSRKRLKSPSVDGTERTVHVGLVGLAVSDLLLCASLLPHGAFREDRFSYRSISFQLIYRTFSGALVNTLIQTSTWLTVVMAMGRYLAICHPFKARHVIGMVGVKASIALVTTICVVFNIPRLFEFHIEAVTCRDGHDMYFRNHNVMMRQRPHNIYNWLYFSFGIGLPLAVLTFCNMRLVKALRESSQLRRRYRVPAAHIDANHRITSILVTIVVMYILLVSPAEILRFIQDRMRTHGQDQHAAFVMAVEVTNVLQTINFSCNFVLYYILNVNFRQGLRDLLCLCCGGVSGALRRRRSAKTRSATLHTSLQQSWTPVERSMLADANL